MLTPEQLADKWRFAVEYAVDTAIESVNKMEVSPIVDLLSKKQRVIDNWNASINSGKWEDNLSANSDLQEWKNRTVQGWERNRTIPDFTKDKLAKHYGELQSVTNLLPQILDYIRVSNPISNPLPWMNDGIISQLVSAALSKHKTELLGEGSITTIVTIIASTLNNQFNFTGDGGINTALSIDGEELFINGEALLIE